MMRRRVEANRDRPSELFLARTTITIQRVWPPHSTPHAAASSGPSPLIAGGPEPTTWMTIVHSSCIGLTSRRIVPGGTYTKSPTSSDIESSPPRPSANLAGPSVAYPQTRHSPLGCQPVVTPPPTCDRITRLSSVLRIICLDTCSASSGSDIASPTTRLILSIRTLPLMDLGVPYRLTGSYILNLGIIKT